MLNIKNNNDDIRNHEVGIKSSGMESMSFRMLPLELIFANPDQPRRFFDKQELENLAQSIKENGVLQPILVRGYGNKYQIVAGERRYRASKIAGLKKIPAVIRKINTEKRMLASLIENIQREDLNPIEEAETLKEILLTFGLTHDQLARKVGKSRSALTNRLRLLQLPDSVKKLIMCREISAGHAKMLAGLKSTKEVERWCRRIVSNKLSVSETEKLLSSSKSIKSSISGKRKRKNEFKFDLHVRAVEEKLQGLLGAKVKIKSGKKKSKIEIEYYDNEDLERILDLLALMYE